MKNSFILYWESDSSGSITKLLSCLLGCESAFISDFLVPFEEFVMTLIMWVVFFFEVELGIIIANDYFN